MKRAGLWVMGIGLCITMGLLTVKHGYAEDKDDTPTCTLKTLQGRYLFSGIATLLPPALGMTEGQALSSAAGYHIFHGDGTGTDIVTARLNGDPVVENEVFPFSYTVNADYTGAYTVPNGPSFGMFIAPNGEELVVIGMDPGTVSVFGPSRRVSRK